MESKPTVRLDKWLWAARFFKTRALAAQSCELGRIHSNDHQAKPARDVRIGDHLRIKNDSGLFEVEVLQLSEVRGPAATAQTLYRETEASKTARDAAEEARKALDPWDQPTGRPTKKDRRTLNKARGRIIGF
jgi:ribosome-associated heat shock protein Hsp15